MSIKTFIVSGNRLCITIVKPLNRERLFERKGRPMSDDLGMELSFQVLIFFNTFEESRIHE